MICAGSVAIAVALVYLMRRGRLAPSIASLALLPALVVWVASLRPGWSFVFGYAVFAVALNVGVAAAPARPRRRL